MTSNICWKYNQHFCLFSATHDTFPKGGILVILLQQGALIKHQNVYSSFSMTKTIVIIKFWISFVCFLFINVQPIYHLDYNKNNNADLLPRWVAAHRLHDVGYSAHHLLWLAGRKTAVYAGWRPVLPREANRVGLTLTHAAGTVQKFAHERMAPTCCTAYTTVTVWVFAATVRVFVATTMVSSRCQRMVWMCFIFFLPAGWCSFMCWCSLWHRVIFLFFERLWHRVINLPMLRAVLFLIVSDWKIKKKSNAKYRSARYPRKNRY